MDSTDYVVCKNLYYPFRGIVSVGAIGAATDFEED